MHDDRPRVKSVEGWETVFSNWGNHRGNSQIFVHSSPQSFICLGRCTQPWNLTYGPRVSPGGDI